MTPQPDLLSRLRDLVDEEIKAHFSASSNYCWWCNRDVNGKDVDPEPHDPDCWLVRVRALLTDLDAAQPPALEERLRALAVEGAEQNHEDDALFEEGRGGHEGEFATCPHPDCVLVRTPAAAVPSVWPQPTDDLSKLSYDELSKLAIRVGCETEFNRRADIEFKRRGYEFIAPLALWALPMSIPPQREGCNLTKTADSLPPPASPAPGAVPREETEYQMRVVDAIVAKLFAHWPPRNRAELRQLERNITFFASCSYEEADADGRTVEEVADDEIDAANDSQ